MHLCGNYSLALFLYFFQNALKLIQTAIPIILMVMTIFDVTRLMMNPDDEKRKKGIKNKFIATLIIFFLPIIVSVFMNLVDENFEFASCYSDSTLMMSTIQATSYISTNEGSAIKIIQDEEYESGTPTVNVSANHNVEEFMQAVRNTVAYARAHNYHYGNSTVNPPTSDGLISCDRLISRALWDIGYTDQNVGGLGVNSLDSYLISHGWKKSTNINDCKYGSVVIVGPNGINGAPKHAFVCAGYNPSLGIMQTFDEGGEWRIHSEQPFTTDTWKQSLIYGVYNMP